MENKIQLGLIGRKLGHSFSKKYFENKFNQEGISDYEFNAYEIQEIKEINSLTRIHNLAGISVTIPYKVDIINFCHHLSEDVRKIGAVNCVKVLNGKLYGHNTDYLGFLEGLDLNFFQSRRSALICGTGGASLAIKYALKKEGFDIIQASTSGKTDLISYDSIDKSVIDQVDLIVNCTPLGTFPHMEESIDIPYEMLGPQHYCYDLVYNPEMTQFLEKSAAQGAYITNGLKMLESQAEYSWKIWTN